MQYTRVENPPRLARGLYVAEIRLTTPDEANGVRLALRKFVKENPDFDPSDRDEVCGAEQAVEAFNRYEKEYRLGGVALRGAFSTITRVARVIDSIPAIPSAETRTLSPAQYERYARAEQHGRLLYVDLDPSSTPETTMPIYCVEYDFRNNDIFEYTAVRPALPEK